MWNEERGVTLRFLRSKQGGAWWKGFPSVRNGKDHQPLAVRGSVNHSTIHKVKSNKMQQCIKILLLHIYMKLNMFRATHRPSSGA